MLQEFVWNQGNGWDVTIEELGRYFERVASMPVPPDASPDAAHEWAFGKAAEPPPTVAEAIGAYLATAGVLGRRTGELHVELAAGTDPAFVPEPFTAADAKATADAMNRTRRRTAQSARRCLFHGSTTRIVSSRCRCWNDATPSCSNSMTCAN